eukprot:gnl/TRDRNA2_/TRDRNA2_35925_c1_seq1.p1 gnl/TRDRNA2_/TRDRNA2_35925_c1~~gnl/TRDRNA2_/TRDRNA2_35925_c1_seq1.p1  ORF type:complete len:739 (-),score=151.72 gnl/TRDRNA2_/TRDRNA2_35925_c1_seq1:97-2205(-)
MAEERSDTFGRTFHMLYPQDGQIAVPSKEDAVADSCQSLPAARQSVIEARTLSIVRFMHRALGLDCEGLILEFIFDSNNRSILHACWGSTLFDPDQPRRKPSTHLPIRAAPPPSPCPFPVPKIGGEDEDWLQSAEECDGVDCDEAEEDVDMVGLSRLEAELQDSPRRRSVNEGGLLSASSYFPEHMLLLEVWNGDEFLGEAIFSTAGTDSSTVVQHRIELKSGASPAHRLDMRKLGAPAISGVVFVSVVWVEDDEGRRCFRFVLQKAESLQESGSQGSINPRVLLWVYMQKTQKYAPLWKSKELQNAANPTLWNSSVDLSLPEADASSPVKEQQPRTPGTPASRPASARARLEKNFAEASTMNSAGGFASPQAQSQSHAQQPGHQHCIATSVKSPREIVCGAEMAAHWGMSGTNMSASVLASQVLQRYACTARINRSLLLNQISDHLSQYHEFEMAWQEQFQNSKQMLAQAAEESDWRRQDTVHIKEQTLQLAESENSALVSVMRDMCTEIDEHKAREYNDNAALDLSQKRLAEQTAMVKQLTDHNNALQECLDKTIRKFDEVSGTLFELHNSEPKKKDPAAQSSRERDSLISGKDLSTALDRAGVLRKEREADEAELDELNNILAQLQDTLAVERNHGSRVEAFVRRIATGPPPTVRAGGGFHTDPSAKVRAAQLLEEARQLRGSSSEQRAPPRDRPMSAR